jgi:hypothetical protein
VTIIDLPDELGHVELSPTKDGYSASITRRRVDETVAWQAFPPEGERDAWISVTATDGSDRPRHFVVGLASGLRR